MTLKKSAVRAGMYLCFSLILVSLSSTLYSCYTNNLNPAFLIIPSTAPFNNMLGVNAYEWNFLQGPAHPDVVDKIYEPKYALIKPFTSVRHYLDWSHLELQKDHYTFNPSHQGSWNYDAMYARCQQDGIMVLACIKTCPQWLVDTYPANERDNENVPAPYNSPKNQPSSYLQQAKLAFQFAARYGNTKTVNPALVKIDTAGRWRGDDNNQKKIGLGYIKYIECDNERDKWWKGEKAHQTAEEYAANLSAFYDGDKGKLGKNAGVKNADPTMQVVMGGLADPDINYIKGIVEWCKKHRGYKPNGQIDLCFDVINYHFYSGDDDLKKRVMSTKGIAPEASEAGNIANQFVSYARSLPNKPSVWVTEAGYDINQQSIQRAVATPQKSALLVQADWIVRTSFLYMRHGIDRLFFFQLFDDTPNNGARFATSGLSEETKRRPAADYVLQVRKLIGNYHYSKTINEQPLVDVYTYGKQTCYVVINPKDESNLNYQLPLGAAKRVTVYHLKPGADEAAQTLTEVKQGKINLNLDGTPIIIKIL